MLYRIMAFLLLGAGLALGGCAPTAPSGYYLAASAWTCQEPEAIAGIEKGARAHTIDADAVQQHRCALNPVNWPAHVMRVDGDAAYLCDAFAQCPSGAAVFCQYALVADIRDAHNQPADPAALLALARQGSLQDLTPAHIAMCPAASP